MERTREQTVTELHERHLAALDALGRLREELGELQDEFDSISSDALYLSFDEYDHDPRHLDDYRPECEAVDAVYHAAENKAETLLTLQTIFDALLA